MASQLIGPTWNGWAPAPSRDFPFDPRRYRPDKLLYWWDTRTGVVTDTESGYSRVQSWTDRIQGAVLAPPTPEEGPFAIAIPDGIYMRAYPVAGSNRRWLQNVQGLSGIQKKTNTLFMGAVPITTNDYARLYLYPGSTYTSLIGGSDGVNTDYRINYSGGPYYGLDSSIPIGWNSVCYTTDLATAVCGTYIHGQLGASSTAVNPDSSIDSFWIGQTLGGGVSHDIRFLDICIWSEALDQYEIAALSSDFESKYPGLDFGGSDLPVIAGTPAAYFVADRGLTLSGSNVVIWRDQSLSTSLPGHQLGRLIGQSGPVFTESDPTYGGKGSIRITTTNDALAGDGFVGGGVLVEPCTVYIVGDKNADCCMFNGLYGGTSPYYMMLSSSGGAYEIAVPGHYTDGGVWPNNTPGIICEVFNGTSSALYANTISTPTITLDTAGVGRLDGFTIGGYQGGGFPINGRVATVLVYKAAHTEPQRQAVMQFLSHYYSLPLV